MKDLKDLSIADLEALLRIANELALGDMKWKRRAASIKEVLMDKVERLYIC